VQQPILLSLDADEKINRVRVVVSNTAAELQVRQLIAPLGLLDSIVVFERGVPATPASKSP
jgi:hypothetical protein